MYLQIQFSSGENASASFATVVSRAPIGEQAGSPLGQVGIGCARPVAKLLNPVPGMDSDKAGRANSAELGCPWSCDWSVVTAPVSDCRGAKSRLGIGFCACSSTGESKGVYSTSERTRAENAEGPAGVGADVCDDGVGAFGDEEKLGEL